MKALWRVRKYIWPQWHRLVTILCSALLIGTLFSFSIATILPLLKVMMGEEGLHGWINRTICESRYGLSFYVPGSVDLSDPNKPEVAYQLRVVKVKRRSPAWEAGLKHGDLIVGAGSSVIRKDNVSIPSSQLLRELATISNVKSIVVQYGRTNESGRLIKIEKELQCGKKPFYADRAQKLLRFVPQGQSRQNKKKAVVFIIFVMVIVTAVRCIARFYQDYTVEKVVDTSLAWLREDTFRHSLEMPVGFFAGQGPSNTVSRFIADTGLIAGGLKVLFGKTLREPLKAVGMIAAAMWIDPNMTLVFLCGGPPAIYAITTLGRKIKRATRKSLASWAKMLGKLTEAMRSLQVIKVFNRQDYEQASFTGINRRLLKQQFRIAKVDASTEPLLEMLGMIAGSVGLMFGAQWVYSGTMQASDFFVLLILLGASAESVRKTSDVWNKLQQANAGAERVFQILDQSVEPEKVGAVELAPLRGTIEFEDVVFSYPGTDRPVLKGVNLSVQAGQNVAIVGPNGSGKTTLANLLPRFYDPDSGRILIDAKDIRDVTLFSLRSQIGMVTQQVMTFHDTIAANIAYGKLNAAREEIIDAAKRAFAHEFICPLPDGYDSILGEHGAGLSGGQLQRIVIARAILKNPSILIFDEATSQVDADSEAKIYKAIQEIMHDRTSFVIAHRFSTVITADVIVVMDEGRIVAQGQHPHLMQRCPLYQSLYETQLIKA
ncbi:MAG TPA: ABC transporter ATP-binding protein [Sedimentisphaerales bacterium]|nr:ABC transporter ATP-binding protein [Sedimentisphaerales bacterium]